MSPVRLATLFALSQPVLASAVVGATSVPQLLEILDAESAEAISDDVRYEVEQVHARYPNPTP